MPDAPTSSPFSALSPPPWTEAASLVHSSSDSFEAAVALNVDALPAPESGPREARVGVKYGAVGSSRALGDGNVTPCATSSSKQPARPSAAAPRRWPSALLHWYLCLLSSRPLLTKCWTSGVLGAISDLIAQTVEQLRGVAASDGVEWRRVGALGLVGVVLTGPMYHYLYEVLENFVPAGTETAGAVRNALAQVAVDQLLAAPVWVVLFYVLFTSLERGTFVREEVASQISRHFMPSLKLAWIVFPVCQLVSFVTLPHRFRVLILNLLDLGYTTALSLLKHA